MNTWTVPLFITHLVPYLLIPMVMVVFHKRVPHLTSVIRLSALIQIGLLCLIGSMVAEFAWHHFIQSWNYQNDTHILNGLMYGLMVTGFAFMALRLLRIGIRDVIIICCVIAVPIVYAINIKPVIWVIQTWMVIEITLRALRVLNDKQILFFPFLTIVVNMAFIFLLFSSHHPVFHILHDLLGTLLGFALFGYLFWINPPRRQVTG